MFIEQAFKIKNDGWRYVVGAIVAFIGSQIIGAIPLFIAIMLKIMQDGSNIDMQDMGQVFSMFDKNVALALVLIPFTIGLLILFAWVKWIHNQSFKSLTTSRRKIDWKRILFSFTLWAVITVAFTVLDYKSNPEHYIWNFDWSKFAGLLLIAVIMIPLQTSFEEYLFRGYLMQGIGINSKSRLAPLIITSVIFGLMHIFNPEVSKIGYVIMVYYIGTGLFLGILTLMDEGLELALGFHAANNLITALLVTANWTAFQTNSILIDVSEPSAGIDILVPVLVVFPVLLLLFSKVYKWSDWKGKLTGELQQPIQEINLEGIESSKDI